MRFFGCFLPLFFAGAGGDNSLYNTHINCPKTFRGVVPLILQYTFQLATPISETVIKNCKTGLLVSC